MLDTLSLWDTQILEDINETFRTEESHQIILKRNEELGLTRVTLSTRTST